MPLIVSFVGRVNAYPRSVPMRGGPGGLGTPGGGVAGVEPPLRGVPEAVGCRQGVGPKVRDFPPPE
jgi:hypothetical protein